MREETVGKPVDRVDGRLKVTGQARYASEFRRPAMTYAVLVQSTISKGKIASLDTADAQKVPGALAILTYKNMPRLKDPKKDRAGGGMYGDTVAPMQTDVIHSDGENVAVVIADSLENAQLAASKVKVGYTAEKPDIEPETSAGEHEKPAEHFGRKLQMKRGNVEGALAGTHAVIEQTYSTPVEHHNPMEPSGTVAEWDGDRLTIYDATQGIVGDRRIVSDMLGIPLENVRVVCPFVGGGFGCKGATWSHTILAAVAAQKVGRPVNLTLTRPQMFTSVGKRGRTIQRLTLAADETGKLAAINHATQCETSLISDFIEGCGLVSSLLYASPNFQASHEVFKLNTTTSTSMRAPGEAPGSFALESAMDELAYKLKVDPIQLRLTNHADADPQSNKPWSSKHLKECYAKAAEAFGWSKRNPEPGSMRVGRTLIGWGMATAAYPGNRSAASAKAQISADGIVTVISATQDLGTGTYTIMSQIAADAMGVPVSSIRFELGDSLFPKAPVSGGSQTAASVGPAVQAAVEALRKKLTALSQAAPNSPLRGKPADQISFGDSRIFLKDDETKGESYKEIVKRSGQPLLDAEATASVATKEPLTKEVNPAEKADVVPDDPANADKEKHTFWSFGAQFVEVRVDPDTREVRVSRVVSAFNVGRILNRKTARSQAIGGIVFGVGAALLEETVRDPKTGRFVNTNLADYRVPVNADIPDVEILFVDEPDPFINLMGSRGIGEIGITGMAAAIANAVYHATGKRVRDLPITPEKLL